MRQLGILIMTGFIILSGCTTNKTKKASQQLDASQTIKQRDIPTKHLKTINKNLPTIGLLVYDDVLVTEVTAASDVFSKPTEGGKQLFNVITIAEKEDPIVSEEGLKILPDYTFQNCPELIT